MRKLILALLLMPLFAGAGDRAGNGGDVVVCRDASRSIRSIELLDFYEARQSRGLQVDLPTLGSVSQILEVPLKRLERLSPVRADLYRNWIAQFELEAEFSWGVNLPDIPDSQHLFFPAGCAVEQIVIQNPDEGPKPYRYLVNGELWDALDERNRAGLVLHEIIYREATEEGANTHPRAGKILENIQQDSRGVRYLNSRLCSKGIEETSELDFFALIVQLGFQRVEYRGNVLSLFDYEPEPFHPDRNPDPWKDPRWRLLTPQHKDPHLRSLQLYPSGAPLMARVFPGSRVNMGTAQVAAQGWLYFSPTGRILALGNTEEFDFQSERTQLRMAKASVESRSNQPRRPWGALQNEEADYAFQFFSLEGNFVRGHHISGRSQAADYDVVLGSGEPNLTSFYADGSIRKSMAYSGWVTLQGQKFSFTEAHVERFEEGAISDLTLLQPESVRIAGPQGPLECRKDVSFYRSGKLSRCGLGDTQILVPIEGKATKVKKGVDFYENGGVDRTTLAQDVRYRDESGAQKICRASSFVELTETGKIKECRNWGDI